MGLFYIKFAKSDYNFRVCLFVLDILDFSTLFLTQLSSL